MKKKTHLLSIAALSMFLVACGDKPSTTSAAPAAPEPVVVAPVPDTTPPATAAVEPAAATPATPQDVPASAAAAPLDAAPAAATAGGMAPVSDTAMGKGVYDKACALCHVAGVAGAPKLTDKADWAPRIAQGKETLYKHAIEGYQGAKGMMPPKGGSSMLSDEQVKASVDYMTSQAM